LSIRPIGACKRIEIGAKSFLNVETRFGCPESKITIGKGVMIGPRVCFETVNHGLRYEPGKGRGAWSKPIVVEDEAWIGAGVIVLQGVTIGRGAVVAAGSVVTRDVPPEVVVAGSPARVIKHIAPS
jgi:maltose O-acetyltransferase